MQHKLSFTGHLSDVLIHDALKHWNTSIVESGNDFNRMKSTLTAIMPHLMQEPDIETAALAAAKTRQSKQNRRYKKLMRRCSQLNNALIKAKATKPVDVAAVKKQAYAHATRIAETYINGEYEAQGCAAQMIFDELRALSAEPAQGSYSVTDELRDLQQSILQSKTLADFNAVKKTVEALTGPTSEAEV